MKIRSPRTLTETTNLAGSATNKVSRTMYKCSLPSYPEFSWGLQTHAPQCGSCVGVQRWSQPSPRCRLDWVYGWCGPAESGCFHRRQSTKQLPYNNTKRKNRWFRSCASFFSFLTSTSWAHIYHTPCERGKNIIHYWPYSDISACLQNTLGPIRVLQCVFGTRRSCTVVYHTAVQSELLAESQWTGVKRRATAQVYNYVHMPAHSNTHPHTHTCSGSSLQYVSCESVCACVCSTWIWQAAWMWYMA